ncbi:unnamed protein product [Citrullus colocynthis]|uniref:VQ domain-containing protein n=1 Tax=Citrullus colocynthis TaxID=252529 RepID=A0ABP0YJF1_9ROSI
MDSGSSGSIQSSSGGEEEYDSRAEGFSGFLNKPPGHVGPMATTTKANPSPPAAHHPHSSSSLFDPFSNFLDPLPTRSHQNSIPNLDFLWPRNQRSDHNPIQLPGSISMPPSSTQPQSYMTPTNSQVLETHVHQAPPGLTLTTDRSDVVPNNTNNNTATATASNNASVRNPRKRTRASRRAPTTVLTTDTSNFRAMVQEFTGIPAPPFTPASSFPRARLDLFGGTSTSSPPYLLRPFPQKLTTTTNSLLSPSSDFLLPKQNHHLPPISSIFNLQPPPPPPLHQPNINLLGSDHQTTTDTHRNHHLHQTPLPEELLSGSGNILPTTWGSGGNGGGGGASDQALFRSMNSKYCTGTKLNNNYSASSSSLDFHGDKGSENVTTRSEGMIESWICSSD